MANKKSIAELLQEANLLKKQMAELKKQNQEKKKAIAVEYADGLSETEKQKQIAEAEKILNTAKIELQKAKEDYKAKVKNIKENSAFAKSILDFVHYKNTNSLPKQKNSFAVNGNMLTFKREGIKDITIDINNANWQQNFKVELKKQGINGENRIADNIVYKASQLVKSNIAV